MREEPVKCSGCTKGAVKLGCPVHDQQRRFESLQAVMAPNAPYLCVIDESAGQREVGDGENADTRPERIIRDVLEQDGYTTDPDWAHVHAALDALVAERDRAVKALERIAAHPHGGILVNIARAALTGGGTHE